MNQKQMLEKNKNKNKQTNPSPQNFVRGYSINVTNQNLDSLGKAKNSMPQNFQLEKPTKRVFFINLFLFQLGIINFVILTYFYMQQDISFRATGWFPIPENIHWYHIFLVLILVRMLIVFITHHLTEYIKNFSLWTEKKKKNALYALAAVNLLTLPINLPLIGGFYAYMKGNEIISNNWFLGTFRRVLSENERAKFYDETVQNFLEKIKISKEIKDQLKNWTLENAKTFSEKYNEGSAFATEYILEKLEIQKEFLQHEEIKNQNQAIKIENFIEPTAKDQQELLPWMFDKTMNGLNYFNPFVTDYQTCAIAWIILLGTGFIILVVSTNFKLWNEIKHLKEDLKDIKTNAESTQEQTTSNQQLAENLTIWMDADQTETRATLLSNAKKINKNTIKIDDLAWIAAARRDKITRIEV